MGHTQKAITVSNLVSSKTTNSHSNKKCIWAAYRISLLSHSHTNAYNANKNSYNWYWLKVLFRNVLLFFDALNNSFLFCIFQTLITFSLRRLIWLICRKSFLYTQYVLNISTWQCNLYSNFETTWFVSKKSFPYLIMCTAKICIESFLFHKVIYSY